MTMQTGLTYVAAPEGVAPGAGYTQVVALVRPELLLEVEALALTGEAGA